MKIRALLIALGLGQVAFASSADAQVDYTATDISGSTWEYTYTITNSFLSSDLTEFTTFFNLGEYSNLQVLSSPSNWSPIVAQPDAGLPADGLYDALALDSGLAAGATQSSFSVEFTFNGTGTPGAQLFNIVDSDTFATLASGQTTLAGGSVTAPEIDPGALASALTLLLGGLAVARGFCRRLA